MNNERGGIDTGIKEIEINPKEPTIIAVFGRSGVGKTALAAEIAKRLGVRLLSSDDFRRKRYGTVQYKEWHSNVAMEDMLNAARTLFVQGEFSIVLDATFSKWRNRETVKAVSNKFGKRLVWIEVISQDNFGNGRNIDGNLLERQFDELTNVGSRVVVDNSIQTEAVDEQMKNFADLVISD